jgi:hypothetical protein
MISLLAVMSTPTVSITVFAKLDIDDSFLLVRLRGHSMFFIIL